MSRIPLRAAGAQGKGKGRGGGQQGSRLGANWAKRAAATVDLTISTLESAAKAGRLSDARVDAPSDVVRVGT